MPAADQKAYSYVSVLTRGRFGDSRGLQAKLPNRHAEELDSMPRAAYVCKLTLTETASSHEARYGKRTKSPLRRTVPAALAPELGIEPGSPCGRALPS